MNRPVFSLCHTTARVPTGWVRAYQHWMRGANHVATCEYILCVDAGNETAVEKVIKDQGLCDIRIAVNGGPRSAAKGWNRAAEMAVGRILITISDDVFPPPNWDIQLLGVLAKAHVNLDSEFVIHVSDGSPSADSLMTFSLLSAKRYEKLGYVFWPEYQGMYGDNEFTEHAYRDGIVIDAKHLVFKHEHPVWKTAPDDAVYQWQNRPEAYALGKEIFERRRAAGFPPLPWRGGGSIPTTAKRQSIAVAMPGANFGARWVMNLLGLIDDLRKLGYDVVPPFNCYSSDVSVTREVLRHNILKLDPLPDFVLWMDDDNLIHSQEFRQLMLDLEAFPELWAAFAWCWGQSDDYPLPPWPSCGRLNPDRRHGIPFSPQELYDQAMAGNLLYLGYSGFPACLMRTGLLTKLGKYPFAPLVGEDLDHGKSGEDFAFCVRASEAGCEMAVDPRVKIPHLKRGAYEPNLSGLIKAKQPDQPENLPPIRTNGAIYGPEGYALPFS